MQVTPGRLLGALVAVALVGAAPAGTAPVRPQVFKNKFGPDISVPRDSPLKFEGIDKDGLARFSGRFVLTGTFAYWCEIGDCGPDEQPLTEDDLMMTIIVDPAVSARLPHWGTASKLTPIDWRHMQIEIDGGADRLANAVVPPEKLQALLAGKIRHVEGRVAIVADHFIAGLSCDNSPYYSADFVRFATPAEAATHKVEGIDTCP